MRVRLQAMSSSATPRQPTGVRTASGCSGDQTIGGLVPTARSNGNGKAATAGSSSLLPTASDGTALTAGNGRTSDAGSSGDAYVRDSSVPTAAGAGSPPHRRPRASPAPRRSPSGGASGSGAGPARNNRAAGAEAGPEVLLSEEGSRSHLASAVCRVLYTYLLDAPSLSSRIVRVNGASPVAHPDGTTAPFFPAYASPSGASGGHASECEVIVPAGAVLFAVVACEPNCVPHVAL
jgi:hypothetical protein